VIDADAHVERRPDGELAAWTVRAAVPADLEDVVAAVTALLEELGAAPPPRDSMLGTARALIADEGLGAVVVALDAGDGHLVGVLGASWQSALRVPGRYGLVQELWVDRAWRSRRIGADLLARLFDLARRLGVGRIEVGLPGEQFSGIAATRAFYAANGFEELGTRMRMLL
jgi:GNAT superfamily N-acetyltransferase